VDTLPAPEKNLGGTEHLSSTMSRARTPDPADARVLAVTVNYRTPELAVRCLESLARERATVRELRAVVVDNASRDGSLEQLQRVVAERGWASWVRLLASPRNGGFGAGNNLALRTELRAPGRAPPDHVLFLNPDAALLAGALAELVAFLAATPAAGMAGPATWVDGRLRGTAFRFPGILNALDEGLHLGPVTRLLGRWQLAPPPRVEPHPTDWLSGGCLLVRRALLEEVGPFDEGFFLYFEEVDLAARAHAAGWESWYVPAARALHDAGAATGATGGRALERRMPPYWFESRRRYFLKHRGPAARLLADLAWAGGNALWNLRRALSRAPRREPPDFWRDFVRFNLLRRELREVR
jgi:N-acetylglucosaminyl-diphospho-decaprenol L-rhamnosyltransferase